jgi:hypothetical protein
LIYQPRVSNIFAPSVFYFAPLREMHCYEASGFTQRRKIHTEGAKKNSTESLHILIIHMKLVHDAMDDRSEHYAHYADKD